ncbi:hypothetical protein WI95_31255 [Burkholderia contaminans]|nr:hypothetical protein WI95_31255 [Burkholderia contaminans]RQT26349.1 hypothetical protein DF036_31455 [Burkholderia contaminans]TCW72273.1 hypothetical protein C5O79_05140 [Burkholderia sp. SRS-25]
MALLKGAGQTSHHPRQIREVVLKDIDRDYGAVEWTVRLVSLVSAVAVAAIAMNSRSRDRVMLVSTR